MLPSLLDHAALAPDAEARIDALADDLIRATQASGFGGVEAMLREYALSTKEDLALMVLSEALLRVPDAATADRLIEDKSGQGVLAQPRRADAGRRLRRQACAEDLEVENARLWRWEKPILKEAASGLLRPLCAHKV
jgi:hypothetical protein